MSGAYAKIKVAGGDTSAPINLEKRIRLIVRHCDVRAVRFLDCGCGAGAYVFTLVERFGTDAWGIEYMAEKVAEAHAFGERGQRIRQGDLEAIAEPDASFDAALLNEVLEHVPDDYAAMREVHRILRPGGRLLVFSPNRFFPFETHGTHLRRSGRLIPVWMPFIPYLPLNFGQMGLRYGARNYWPKQLRSQLESAGFKIVATDFVWPSFENISGSQPALIRIFRPVFRWIAQVAERTPLIRCFGISQMIVAEKPR